MEEKIKINKGLIEKYPFLIPRNVETGEVVEGYDYTYNKLEASIPEGWWNAWGEKWCEDLLSVCKQNNIDPKEIRINQSKEKYGSLRVYLSGYPKGWDEHEFAWDYISQHTCINCGKFPVPMRDDGWMSPYCGECFQKFHKDADEEKLRKWTYKFDGRPMEFIGYFSLDKNDKEKHIVDMKPYYEMIGYKGELNPGLDPETEYDEEL